MLSKSLLWTALVAVLSVFSLFATTTRAQAGEGSLSGYAICSTPEHGNTFYVAGEPIYISEIFKVSDESSYGQAFRDFLKQKYGWTKYVNCNISYAADGATKTFDDMLKHGGKELVRTGWTDGKGSWLCTLTTGDDTSYFSGIFTATDTGNARTDIASAFAQFVTAKYGVKAPFHGAPTCIDYGDNGGKKAQDALKGFTSHGGKFVLTGWID